MKWGWVEDKQVAERILCVADTRKSLMKQHINRHTQLLLPAQCQEIALHSFGDARMLIQDLRGILLQGGWDTVAAACDLGEL